MAKFLLSNQYAFPDVIHIDPTHHLHDLSKLVSQNEFGEFNPISHQDHLVVHNSTIQRVSRETRQSNLLSTNPKSLSIGSILPFPWMLSRPNKSFPKSYHESDSPIVSQSMTRWITQVQNDDDIFYQSLMSAPETPLCSLRIRGDNHSVNECDCVADAAAIPVTLSELTAYPDSHDSTLSIHPKRVKKWLRKQRQKEHKSLGKMLSALKRE
jgi:hypothetical protein